MPNAQPDPAAALPSGAPGPRILFSSPVLPFPKASIAEDNIDFFYYRNTLGQGVFQLRQWASWHPLHFLAQNLPVDAVVLENPSWASFRRELATGAYQVVAITFTVPMACKVLEMVSWVREHHPGVEIIVGGHGAMIFAENLGIEKEIAARVDAICRGEGVAFMREYLARRWGVTGTVPPRQDLEPMRFGLCRSRRTIFRQLAVVASFGCANGCSFCSTSAYFGRRRIDVLSGRELYQALRRAADRHPRVQMAGILDENFLANRERALEFMACLEADAELRRRPLLLTIFASVSEIARYSVEELARCNIGTIFVGVESFRKELLADEELHKREGLDIGEMFDKLHDAGIATLGSLMLGWDAHTPENVAEEVERFVALEPTFYQIIPLHPIPGTRLWRRMSDEGRIVPGYRYEDDGVSRTNFAFKHFGLTAIHDLALRTYHRMVETAGPWPFRSLRVYWRGWRNLSRSPDPLLRERAAALRQMAFAVLALALASRLLCRGRGFRQKWRETFREVARAHPVRLSLAALLLVVLLPLLGLLRLGGTLRHRLSRDGDQPESLRREYRGAVLAERAGHEGASGGGAASGREDTRSGGAAAGRGPRASPVAPISSSS